MDGKLLPIKLPPGLFRNGTPYQAKGRWFDANGVRFIEDSIRPIGGWRYAPSDSGGRLLNLTGVPRGAIAWRDDSGSVFVAIGTTTNLYVLAGGILHDITPAGFVAGLVDTVTPGTASQGSSTYGSGSYGSGAYGVGSTLGVRNEADIWQFDVFGNYLAAVCSSTKKLYVWDGNVAHVAAIPAGAPSSVTGVVVTPERFLIALGANGDTRQIAWPSQESTTDWTATNVNSAGDLPVTTEGGVTCGARTRRDTLIWTDADMHTLTYVGGELIYRIDKAGDKCGIISPRAKVVVDTQAFWMGRKGFFAYDGFVRPVPCEVHDYVFSDFNETQSKKVWAMSIGEYGEVWWFYCSANSTEINRYVVYNYRENHWTTGTMYRTAGFDAGASRHPMMMTAAGEIFEHELGQDRNGLLERVTENGFLRLLEDGTARILEGVGIFLESGPYELGDGDTLVHVSRVIPDEKTSGDVQISFYTSLKPMAEEKLRGPYDIDDDTPVRFTARQARIRLEQVRDTDWRIGTFRVAVRDAGRR